MADRKDDFHAVFSGRSSKARSPELTISLLMRYWLGQGSEAQVSIYYTEFGQDYAELQVSVDYTEPGQEYAELQVSVDYTESGQEYAELQVSVDYTESGQEYAELQVSIHYTGSDQGYSELQAGIPALRNIPYGQRELHSVHLQWVSDHLYHMTYTLYLQHCQ